MAQHQEVIEHIAPAPLAPVSETAAIIQVIERAAMNPNVDIDKMERLLEMQERIMARNARSAYAAAFAAMQKELPIIPERGKGHGSIKYALWEDTNELIRPVLGRHGFGLSFRTGRAGNMQTVTAILQHEQGHSEEATLELPTDNTGSKNPVQGIGSSTAYGKRYTAHAILNLTSRGEDDNGVSAGSSVSMSDDHIAKLRDALEFTGGHEERFLKFKKVARFEDLRDSDFDACIASIRGARK